MTATENYYDFGDEEACGGTDNSAVFSGVSTQKLNSETLQKKIDNLEMALRILTKDRDQLFEDRCSDRDTIVRLSAELLMKESQIEEMNRLEENISNLHKAVDLEAAVLKRDLADKVVTIQALQMKVIEERNLRSEQNEDLRKQIINCENSNTNLTREVFSKMCLLAEWKDKFDLLKEENAHLKSEVHRLSSSQSYEADLVECFSCKNKFNDNDAQENECYYHPLPPMGYIQWQRWPVAEKVDHQRYHKHRYYACCNTLSKQRPPGCVVGRHHVDWNINLCAIFQENERFMENDDQNPTIIN